MREQMPGPGQGAFQSLHGENLQHRLALPHQPLDIDAQADRRKRQQLPAAALQHALSAGFVASLQVEQADPDQQDPLVKQAELTAFVEPEVFEGFVAGEILAAVELADGGLQFRRGCPARGRKRTVGHGG